MESQDLKYLTNRTLQRTAYLYSDVFCLPLGFVLSLISWQDKSLLSRLIENMCQSLNDQLVMF